MDKAENNWFIITKDQLNCAFPRAVNAFKANTTQIRLF